MQPGTINHINCDTRVAFEIFINSRKEFIVDYALSLKDRNMPVGEIAYHQGVKNSEKNEYAKAITFYKFASFAGYKSADCYYNIGAAYFNLKDTSKACEEWLVAAKGNDKESANFILKNCPELAAKYGITSDHLKAYEDSIGTDENNIFPLVEEMPRFPDGGESGFINYISGNFHYPKMEREYNIQGTVYVQFIIRR